MTNPSVESFLPNIPDNDDPFCVLTPHFFKSCSDFQNFASFIEESPWIIQESEIVTEDGDSPPVEIMDQYVNEHTRFDTWPTLINSATESWDADISPIQRARKRRRCNVTPILIEQSYHEGKGTLVDISVRGAGIMTSLPMPVGGWVKITLPEKQITSVHELPDRTVQLRGLIRWTGQSENQTRAGIELTARLL